MRSPANRDEKARCRRLRTILKLLAAFLLLALLGSELLVPGVVERAVEEAVQAELPEAEQIDVRMRTLPAFRLLQGSVGRATIDIYGVEFEGIEVARVTITGRNVELEREALRNRQVEVRSADNLRVRVEFAAEAFAAYLEERTAGLIPFEVELAPPNSARVVGRVELFGQTLQLGLDGHFEVIGPTRVQFVPDGLILFDEFIPNLLAEQITASWEWEADVSRVPLPLQIEGLFVEGQRLIVEAVWPGAQEGGAEA